jgi:hypothetical protein
MYPYLLIQLATGKTLNFDSVIDAFNIVLKDDYEGPEAKLDYEYDLHFVTNARNKLVVFNEPQIKALKKISDGDFCFILLEDGSIKV